MPTWDRDWVFYHGAAVLDETSGVGDWPDIEKSILDKHKESKKEGWHSYIFELSNPIIMKPKINKIINHPEVNIYPPFPLNVLQSKSHLFDEISIPSGVLVSDESIPIPPDALRGFHVNVGVDDSVACNGLRIDYKGGVPIDRTIEFFLRLVRQYSNQWWLSSSVNPFDTGARLSFEINNYNRPISLLRYKGAGQLESSWFGAAGTQKLVGFEKVVDETIWGAVSGCMRVGYGVEDAVQHFLSAVSHYMAFDDRQCIMNLALMFEIAENKIRIIKDMNKLSKNKDMLRKPIVADIKSIEIFRKIITDRDNVSHGRKPYNYYIDPKIIVEYIGNSMDFINKYINSCRERGWDKALKTSI